MAQNVVINGVTNHTVVLLADDGFVIKREVFNPA